VRGIEQLAPLGYGDQFVLECGTIADGLKEGPWVQYQGGKVSEVSYYVHGRREGISVSLYTHGVVWLVREWRSDKLDGSYFDFDAEGVLRRRAMFRNGLANGSCEWYHGNGALKERGMMVDGEKHGAWEEYDDESKLKVRRRYHHGEEKRSRDL